MAVLSISGCANNIETKTSSKSKQLITFDKCKGPISANAISHVDGKTYLKYDKAQDKECESQKVK